MRKITFRAWYKGTINDHLMIYGIENTYDGLIDCPMFYTSFGEMLEDPDLVIMQFTGLTDKNGKDIYEGDVIKTERGDWGVIVWKSPFFEVTISADLSCLYSREYYDTVEVIGNTEENPELSWV